MTVTSKVLLQGKLLENTQVTQYTSTGTKTIVDLATICNTSNAAQTVDINVVAAAGSADTDNLVHIEFQLAAKETRLVLALMGVRLDSGDFISTIAGNSGVLSMRLGGRVITS